MHFCKSVIITGLSVLCVVSSNGSQDIRTRFYQKNAFILSEPLQFTDERYMQGNDPDLKKLSRTTIQDGLIYDNSSKLLNTGGSFIYALNHDGTLYVGAEVGGKHHSFFLKSKPEKSGYGIGKNVACAGHIEVKQGKIISIDNNSGHYMPTEDQLKVTVQFLFKKGVLDPNIKISLLEPLYEGGGVKEVSLDSIMNESIDTILASYPQATKRTQEYINSRRKAESEFQLKLTQLQPYCPQSFLQQPIIALLPDFKAPSHKGKVDFGEITVENKKWKALMINILPELPSEITQSPSTSFKWGNSSYTNSIETAPQNGVITRYAACVYDIQHLTGKSFNFYLIPEWQLETSPKEESRQESEKNTSEESNRFSSNGKLLCPTLTPLDMKKTMDMTGDTQWGHIRPGHTAVLQKGEYKYRFKFNSVLHIDIPGAKVVLIKDSTELTPGQFVCKYEYQNEEGSYDGDFELALEGQPQIESKKEIPQNNNNNINRIKELNVTPSKLKTSCPALTPDDIDQAMHSVGANQYNHIPAGNSAVIQKGDHKYRLNFTSATHVDVPGAKVVIVKDSPALPLEEFVCKYATQNGESGHNGDFELALVE